MVTLPASRRHDRPRGGEDTARVHRLATGIDVRVAAQAPGADRPQLWPSVGEYPCYDEVMYALMTTDEVRNRAYRSALRRCAPGRAVLDIGTGGDLNWALEADACGARTVTAIEGQPDTLALARRTLARSGRRMELVGGWSTEVEIAEPADVCVSEIIGSIGGAEGAAAVLADARRRLLRPDAVMVPHRCTTLAAGACLQDIVDVTAFAPGAAPYVECIFATAGGPFDLRLAVAGARPEHVLTDHRVVEDLEFNGDLRASQTADRRLTVTRPGRIEGLLLWVQVQTIEGCEPIDALREPTTWGTVYLPLFEEPVEVAPRDVMHVRFSATLSADQVHPDYSVEAELHAGGQRVTAAFASPHRGGGFRTHPLYRLLFP